MSQERPTRKERRTRAEAEQHPSTGRVEVEDIDSILAGVDEILADELPFAQEFWANWRQKGGE